MAKRKKLTAWQAYEKEWNRAVKSIRRKVQQAEAQGYEFRLFGEGTELDYELGVRVHIEKPSKFSSIKERTSRLEALQERNRIGWIRRQAQCWREPVTGTSIGNPLKGRKESKDWTSFYVDDINIQFPSSPKEIKATKRKIGEYFDEKGQYVYDKYDDEIKPVEQYEQENDYYAWDEEEYRQPQNYTPEPEEIPYNGLSKLEKIKEFIANSRFETSIKADPRQSQLIDYKNSAVNYLNQELSSIVSEIGRKGVAWNIEHSGVDVEECIEGIIRASTQETVDMNLNPLLSAILGGPLSTDQSKNMEYLHDTLIGMANGDEEGEY